MGAPLCLTRIFSLYSGNLLAGFGVLYKLNPGLCGHRCFV